MSVIRPATADDVPAILQMIHELAIYEKEPDAVRNTPEMLTEALFGENPRVFATMAENEAGDVQGFALWFLNYSTWEGVHGIYLEDLYVQPGGPRRRPRQGPAAAPGRHRRRTRLRPGGVERPGLERAVHQFLQEPRRRPDGGMVHLPADRRGPGGVRRRPHGAAPVADRPRLLAAGQLDAGLPGRQSRTRSRRGTNTAGCAPRNTTSRCRWTTSAAPARRDHHRLRPRIRLHGPQRGEAARLPWLLYLQGGPGGRGNRLRRPWAAGARPPPRTSGS